MLVPDSEETLHICKMQTVFSKGMTLYFQYSLLSNSHAMNGTQTLESIRHLFRKLSAHQVDGHRVVRKYGATELGISGS